jgi:2-hydroxychromene-2-carboxylate isomerase
MNRPIEFFFDFSSPYSYLASERIEELAARHGREVRFRPTLLGAAFRVSGQRPLTEIPLKGDYSRRDFARCARFAGIDLRMPGHFPISTIDAARALVWLQRDHPAIAVAFVHEAFRTYFAKGGDISDRGVLAGALSRAGADPQAALAAIGEPAIKDALRAQVEEAVARGVFGAPFIIVDGEPFWGHDRFPQIERWLDGGPF